MKSREVGIFDAKAHLSEIIDRVAKGAVFHITRRGKKVAELRPLPAERQPLTRGCARNEKYFMAADFDATPTDMSDYI